MEKRNLQKIASLMMLFVVMFGFAACSNDDEPANDAQTIYESLSDRLYTTDGAPAFNQLDGKYYYYTVANEDEAKEYCESLIGGKLSKDDFTYTLPESYGNLRIVKAAAEGIFYYVYVTLQNHEQFSINICHPEILNDENMLTDLKSWPR